MIGELKPDLRIKDESKKYQKSRIPKELCPTVYIPKLGSVSTSTIIERCRNVY
jgi:hypothetical protein